MDRIDKFLKAIEESYQGINVKTSWPLNGAQVDSYFDVDEALDMYYRLNKLRETKSVKEIADLMPPPDMIRLFLQHNGIIGLKVAKTIGVANIPKEDRLEYVNFLFNILEKKVRGDIFCLDGKNILFDNVEIKDLIKNLKKVEGRDEQRSVAGLIVSANNWCYSLYYDLFMTAGFYLHGPYDVSEKFGEGAILVIREYHDLNPKDLWPDLEMPYKKMRILCVYKNLDLKINFVNHPITKESIADKLVAYKVFLDNFGVGVSEVEPLDSLFDELREKQTKRVNNLADLDKVRKGAEIAFYFFKELRASMGDDWRPTKDIEKTIQKFGTEFIEKFRHSKPGLEHWKRIMDPRNDYY